MLMVNGFQQWVQKLKGHRKSKEDVKDAPVKLSKFWNVGGGAGTSSDSDSEPRRSAISGKKIKRKIKKSKADKEMDKNRQKLLAFLNSTM